MGAMLVKVERTSGRNTELCFWEAGLRAAGRITLPSSVGFACFPIYLFIYPSSYSDGLEALLYVCLHCMSSVNNVSYDIDFNQCPVSVQSEFN